MKFNSLPVSFQNSDGYRLFGILHTPDEKECRQECVIVLSPGIKSRVAPHRLYVKMARKFVEKGFPVLRFDFYGLGDSEGEIEEKYAADFYGSVQVGRYISDTVCAMDWLEKEHKISKFILSGLCGGAITGLLTAARDNRVKGLLGLSIPVILDSSNIVYDEFLTPTELKKKRENYLKKLISLKSWRSWVRFLTFQSDYKLIFRSLLYKKSQKMNNKINIKSKVADNINPFFSPVFEKFKTSGKKILFIFAGSDRLYWQFKEKFLLAENNELQINNNFTFKVIENANHIFSFDEWQKELIEKSTNWLDSNFIINK
jgi:dienelactone hydrolase